MKSRADRSATKGMAWAASSPRRWTAWGARPCRELHVDVMLAQGDLDVDAHDTVALDLAAFGPDLGHRLRHGDVVGVRSEVDR